jgi:flagellar protein FliS
MLYDALVNNIVVAEDALERKDFYTLNERLLRAEEMVLVLRGSLKPEIWSGGPALMSIYAYVCKLLVRGNVHKDAGALSDARKILEPLQAAWHVAADQVLAERAATPQGAPAGLSA